jgi:hypothetical protein
MCQSCVSLQLIVNGFQLLRTHCVQCNSHTFSPGAVLVRSGTYGRSPLQLRMQHLLYTSTGNHHF